MPLSNEAIQGFLKLLLQNQACPNVGDSAGLQPSAADGVFWFALHSADPGASGNQSTNEISYGGYARASLGRGTANYPLMSNTVNLGATVGFPQATSGAATATHASIGSASSGAGHMFWSGPITPNISIVTTVIPELTVGSSFTFS